MYVRAQIVAAKPMYDTDFHEGLSRAEILSTGGIYTPVEGYRVRYENGYMEWMPKEIFERYFREITPAEKMLMASGRT